MNTVPLDWLLIAYGFITGVITTVVLAIGIILWLGKKEYHNGKRHTTQNNEESFHDIEVA